MFRISLALFATLLLSRCSQDLDIESFKSKTAEEIFAEGKTAESKKEYTDAITIYEELEKLYPYSKLNTDAQLAIADCNYIKKKYDEAASAYEVFIRAHPNHEKIAYALYMLAMVNYNQIAIVERDQEMTAYASLYFSELCERFPNSEYTKDAKNKIKVLRNQKAARETYIAKYYQKRKNYAAAIERLNVVFENFSDTDHAPEAMSRLIEFYISIGELKEAQIIFSILEQRYPESNWTKDSKILLESRKERRH